MNEDTFLAALRDNPSDELTWQALADWLIDNGQGNRAELLRFTLQLRTIPARKRGDLPAHHPVARQCPGHRRRGAVPRGGPA